MRNHSYLGQALGRLAAAHDGLTAFYLPNGAPKTIAPAIVHEANLRRSDVPPFAIIVTDDPAVVAGEGVPVVGRAAAIQYRQGSRLAVVPSSTVDIASFDGSFREALGAGFPSTAAPGFDVESLADQASRLLLNIDSNDEPDISMGAELLATCMREVAEILREEREGAATWNALWFSLVDAALSALHTALQSEVQRGGDPLMALGRLCWAAFGLPQATTQRSLRDKDRVKWAKLAVEALGSRWSSEDLVDEVALEAVVRETRVAGALQRCREVGWSGFDDSLARTPSRLMGLQGYVVGDQRRLDAFANIDEDAFFGAPSEAGTATVSLADASSANIGPQLEAPLYILQSTEIDGHRVSEKFRLRLPLLGPEDGIDVNALNVRLTLGGNRYVLGEIEESSVVEGALEFVTAIRGKGAPGEKLDRVTLQIQVGKEERGYLKSQTLTVYVLPPSDAALFVAAANAKRLSTPRLVNPVAVEGDEAGASHELKAGTAHRVVLFGGQGATPHATGVILRKFGERGWIGDLPANTDATITQGGNFWSFEAGGDAISSQSTLLAAVRKVTVDPRDPEDDVMDSLLARLEAVVGARAADPEYLTHAGHIVLPTTSAVPLDALSDYDCALVPQPVLQQWMSIARGQTRPEYEWLDARDRFVEAWVACVELLVPLSDEFSSCRWPSKRSTRPLWDRHDLVDAMLAAYADWVESKHATPFHRFLATYPFSFSGWRFTEGPRPEVVLLSPWHPVRLAWLTAVEEALHGAVRAQELMGTVEGWAFPAIGRSWNRNGHMMAIPMDTGYEDMFAGWAMMVPLSSDDEEPLSAPESLAGLPMPATSASGLTASAADAALRDFRRVNSYLPAITIDLASSVPGRRMAQIDRSVLGAVKSWAKADGRTRSRIQGIEVLDSLNRRGDVPRDDVLGLLETAGDTTVTWRRYQPDPVTPVRSNLRLLQDSGIRMLLESASEGEANGIIGRIPLRRFELPAPFQRDALFQPAIAQATTPFGRALQAVEQPMGEAARIGMYVSQSAVASDDADWSISGDAFVPAAVLARAVSERNSDHSTRMLWEWRPPFLTASGESKLNRRPYASVMRVGSQLTDKIAQQLRTLSADPRATPTRILGTLGAQGIGLSSLLTAGGQNPAGALGFYLGLELMRSTRPADGEIQVVMPIDASRQFLDVLSGVARASDTTRQADLLVLRVRAGEVIFVPIEIKMYGLDRRERLPLARPGRILDEPLAQLKSTMTLLDRIRQERRRLVQSGNLGELALWDNALAALIEAAFRLTDQNWDRRDSMHSALQAIADGDFQLAVAHPLVLFFSHDPDADDEFESFQIDSSGDTSGNGGYGVLSTRPDRILHELSDAGHSAAITAWAHLLEWAVAGAHFEQADEGGTAEAPMDPVLSGAEEEFESEDVVPRRGALQDEESEEVAVTEQREPTQAATPDERGAVGGTGPSVGPDGSGVKSEGTGGRNEGDALDPSVGVRIDLGVEIGRLSAGPAQYWPSNTHTHQLNMGIVGDLGTGKTQLLKSVLVNIRHASRATQEAATTGLVFDYKRDFQDPAFVNAAGATVWKPVGMPLNVLQLREPYSQRVAFKRASAFVSMLERIYANIGPVQRDRLTEVILELFASGQGTAPTLGEVLAAYRQLVPAGDSVTGILKSFVMGEVFSEDKSELVSLAEAMRDTVLVVDLNDLGADSNLKNAIVVLFLDMFYEEMKHMVKAPPRISGGVTLRNITSYLLVDEASNIMRYDFEVLESLLKEGREFGVGVILASQYLSHFKSAKTNFAETLSTWFVHKVPNVQSRELKSLGIVGADDQLADQIKTLKVHQSLYKSDLTAARFIAERPFYKLVEEEGVARYQNE